jgi:hypothetical protein
MHLIQMYQAYLLKIPYLDVCAVQGLLPRQFEKELVVHHDWTPLLGMY